MTAAANSEARKRLAEQDAPDTLTDKLHAFFYSKNTVNWPGSLAEEVAALVAEHYGAAQADAWTENERERIGDVLDNHVGWQMHRALMIDALIREFRRIATDRAALGGDAS